MRELKIFSGQANRPLAKAICNFLHLPLGEVSADSLTSAVRSAQVRGEVA